MELVEKLLELFEREKMRSPRNRAIVFWYDKDAEGRDLEEIQNALEERGISFWELTENNSFYTKYMLEVEKPDTSFLIYAPFERPSNQENLLLDILLYSAEFKTDENLLLAGELGLDPSIAQEFLKKYKVFFREKRRREKFKRWLPAQSNEETWKAIVFAILAQAKSHQPEEVFRTVFEQGLDDESNEALIQIGKFAHLEDFYEWMYNWFGVSRGEKPSLRQVFATIVVSHAVNDVPELAGKLPKVETVTPNTCYVFLEDWLRKEQGRKTLKPLLKELEASWGVYAHLKELSPETVADCTTFPIADQVIIEYLNEILLYHSVSRLPLEEIIDKRKSAPWAQDGRNRMAYDFYSYALALAKFKEGSRKHYHLHGPDWVKAYVEHDYQIDQMYRKLMWMYNEAGMPDEWTDVRERLTEWYEREFLAELSRYTDEIVARELAHHWPIQGVTQQTEFFREFIRKKVLVKTSERVFVIISDALRYEAGVELYEKLRERLNAEVSIVPMQAAVPTYTQLGMACLLPGEITHIDDQGMVYVEGIPARGMSNREKILQKEVPDSRAFRLDEFLQLGKEGLKEIRGKRVVYLYHNRIDATGDTRTGESYTFADVQQAIEELARAVAKLAGSFEAKRIFITADHGFLYQYSPVKADQLADRVDGAVIEQNRRFAIGRNLTVPPGAQKISLSWLGIDLEVVVAKGLNRFRASGGMKYVHGGTMPQEVIVPVIEYREIHGQARKKEEQRVDVRVAMRSKVITNYQFNVVFFQEQKVSNDFRPRHIRAAFFRGEDRISNEVTLVFDSDREAPERHTEVTFILIEDRYPIGEPCVLRMEDVTGAKTVLYMEEPFELRLYDYDIHQ